MNKIATLSVVALAFIAGFLIFYNPKPVSTPSQANSPTSSTQQKWETKTDEQANVTVIVTPLDLSSQSVQWKFDVVMDTHSIELDQDMTKVAVLIDDQGKEYTPLTWEGPTGGHHREGVLSFSVVQPTPRSVELRIRDIAGISERSFKWDLR